MFSDKLSINVMQNNVVLNESDDAKLVITASGVNKKNFTYRWNKKGRRASIPKKASGIHRNMLMIPDLRESDEGNYFCTVTNEWGSNARSDDITLNVQGKQSLHV